MEYGRAYPQGNSESVTIEFVYSKFCLKLRYDDSPTTDT